MSKSDSEPAVVCIALGSNIAPEINLPRAVQNLAQLGLLLRTSSVWRSKAIGDEKQADFCNAAALLETSLSPTELKFALREIEARLGRVRDPNNKYAPRTIDLDIALYGQQIVQSGDLVVPDPEIATRPFLAVPLSELDANLRHPVTGQTLAELAVIAGGTSRLQLCSDIVLT